MFVDDGHESLLMLVSGKNGRQFYQQLSDVIKMNVLAFHDIDEKKACHLSLSLLCVCVCV
jgi:hypothetical protein